MVKFVVLFYFFKLMGIGQVDISYTLNQFPDAIQSSYYQTSFLVFLLLGFFGGGWAGCWRHLILGVDV